MTTKRKGGSFGGVNPTYPVSGDIIEILEGDDAGSRKEVLRIGGYAFNPVYRIYVRGVDDEEVWYWPWNIKIIIEK